MTFFHLDNIGSVRVITDAAGQVVSRYDYVPFGQNWNDPPTSDPNNLQFTGAERSRETKVGSGWSPLDYFGARYYQSQTGRFTRPDDPGFMDPTNPQSMNLYSYAYNNPFRWTDPTGHCSATFCDGVEECIAWFCPRQDPYIPDSALTSMFGDDLVPNLSFNPFARRVSLQVPSQGRSAAQIVQNGDNITKCTGVGRGLRGNEALINRIGGLPGVRIQQGTAAVIPRQFGVASGASLAQYASSIYGTIGNASFSGISDVVGGRSPIRGVPVRTALQILFPGQLILEVQGAADQGANAPVTIFVPTVLGCPTGTATGGN